MNRRIDMAKHLLFALFVSIVILFVAKLLTGCAKASGGVHAESIPNNSGDGATCYAIFDSNENPIGGNCK
jgi:hypothetical protein